MDGKEEPHAVDLAREQNLIMKRALHDHQLSMHPGRNGASYNVLTHPQIMGEYYAADLLFLEWVRQASNVSNIFRQELGEVTWANVVINDYSYISQIPQFLEDRPAIHRGISTISVDLWFTSYRPLVEDYGGKDEFDRFCSSVAQLAAIQQFELAISNVRQSDVGKIIGGDERFLFLGACRTIKVKKDFKLRIILSMSMDMDADDGIVRDKCGQCGDTHSRICRKHWHLIHEVLMPDCLRAKSLPMEMETYLNN